MRIGNVQNIENNSNASYKILAVDDEQGIIDSLSIFLKRSGYSFTGITDPMEAIERIKTEHFDLLLLDFIMTPLHGDQVVEEVRKAIYELGTDGRLIEMQLDELTDGVELEEYLIIKDYVSGKNVDKTCEKMRSLNHDDLLLSQNIAKILGYTIQASYDEVSVYARGYRILNKIPRMPNTIVENIVKKFKSLQKLLQADIKELDDVDGIGEIRARTIKQSLKRMQEQFVFDNLII